MTDFETMTPDEQRRWWQAQAQQALAYFGLPDAALRWLAYTHNAVFDVQHKSGRYVLRLQRTQKAAPLEAEAAVLRRLHAQGLAGRIPLPIQQQRFPQTVAVLWNYLPGTIRSAEEVSERDLRAVGRFLATLHAIPFAAPDVPLPHLDYRGLFGAGGRYDAGSAEAVLSAQQKAVMAAVAQTVQQAMQELGQSPQEFGLIHGDLLLKNVLFHEGEVRALDWEYCGWGYYLYDLTPLLWLLKPQTNYASLEAALWEGYTALRPLTGRHRVLLERFIAGRQVASMRWLAANQRNPHYIGKVPALLAQRTAELQGYLDSGTLDRNA